MCDWVSSLVIYYVASFNRLSYGVNSLAQWVRALTIKQTTRVGSPVSGGGRDLVIVITLSCYKLYDIDSLN